MVSQQNVRQSAGTIEENSVRLDVGKAEQVVEALNIDLAAIYVVHHQLQKHRWSVDGPEYRSLSHFFRGAADDAMFIVDDLANRIHALGGVPLSGPAALERHSPIPFEGEDIYDVRTALANDLQAYGDLIEQTSSHIELAASYGDHATAELLRHHLVVFEEYAHSLDRFLHEGSLTAW